MTSYNEYLALAKQLASTGATGRLLRDTAMAALDRLPGYDWSGIYVLQGDELHLDAFVGAPTDHIVIPVGVGVCGSAVAEDQNKVIVDVRKEGNYLACSLETRAEIVVLIRRGNEILGQIDIDSHTVGRFSEEDEKGLQVLAELLAEKWE